MWCCLQPDGWDFQFRLQFAGSVVRLNLGRSVFFDISRAIWNLFNNLWSCWTQIWSLISGSVSHGGWKDLAGNQGISFGVTATLTKNSLPQVAIYLKSLLKKLSVQNLMNYLLQAITFLSLPTKLQTQC